ncbi:MAG: hydroxymethylbilane synthase, partial [Firmicutes bacterium]|nr:hydroxymethylbilane synthase [Bacillota bacterium]
MIRIGTRSSALAVAQAQAVCDFLIQRGYAAELVQLETQGDKILDRALNLMGSQGVFTTELEQALLHQEIDIAVHSLKDVPTKQPDGLVLRAYALAEDPRDVLLASSSATSLNNIPHGGSIATSSVRRKAF